MFFGEGVGRFGLAQLLVVRGEGSEVGQGLLVVGAFLAAGLFQAVPQDFGIVVCGGEERVELERVPAMRTGRRNCGLRIVDCGLGIADGGLSLDSCDDGARRCDLLAAHGTARLLGIGGGENGGTGRDTLQFEEYHLAFSCAGADVMKGAQFRSVCMAWKVPMVKK